jgi:hypothetical protein
MFQSFKVSKAESFAPIGDYGSVLSRVTGMAEGQGSCGSYLHSNSELSESGNIRFDFSDQARGSLLEAETQLAIALDLGFLEQCAYEQLELESYQVLGLLDRLLSSLSKKTA